METAGAIDIAHMSHHILTHFCLLDIYLLNVDSINTCMSGQLVWKIKIALSGRGREEVPLPSFVFLSSTSSTQCPQYGLTLDRLQPYIYSVLSSFPLRPFWTDYWLLSKVNVNLAKPRTKTEQQKKLYQNNYLEHMASLQLRTWASCFSCCWGECERQLLLLRKAVISSTLILLMNAEAAATALTKPSVFSCAGRRHRMRLSAAYVACLCVVRQRSRWLE